jgi:predicted negative regulator of RcsB-dependent stress response
MAFDAYDDYEQSERVQQWLRRNGGSIVVGVILGLLLIFGWQQWKAHTAGHSAAAANEYQALQSAVAAGKISQADVLTENLLKDFADTPYAWFAAGERAQRDVVAGKLDQAQVSLDWAEAHANDAALKGLTQLRLAQLKLAQDKAADALVVLDRIPAPAYNGLAQELRGDVLVKLGRPDEARKAYEAALSALGESAPQHGVVQMKLDDLATAGKQGA